jgi:hypothetical protein
MNKESLYEGFNFCNQQVESLSAEEDGLGCWWNSQVKTGDDGGIYAFFVRPSI